jgi:hypothetical protein
MGEKTPNSLLSHVETLTTAPPGSALSKWQILVRVIAISIPVVGAVPTATNLYYSWTHRIPFSQVSHRLAQYDLWVKNIDCPIDYHALTTSQGTRIDAGTCPKTGDIAIKVSGAGDAVTYEWIAFDQLQQPAPAAKALLELVATPAYAAEGPPPLPPPAARVGEGAMRVMCQAMNPARTEVVRVVSEGGKCYRVVISPLRGKMERREPVACDARCGP